MSTGVRILPGDTVGYIYADMPASYRMVRSMQEYLAKAYPESRDQIARDARETNSIHLRRLLDQATRGKREEPLSHFIGNLPRAIRRAFQRTGFDKPWSGGTMCVNTDYVLAIDKNRRAIEKNWPEGFK